MWAAAIIAFLAACLASLFLTMAMRKIAPRIGLVDRPDDHRKLHGRPVPMGGGLAVFLATGLVLAVVLVIPNPWNLVLKQDWLDILGFSLAGGGLVALGLVDDRWGLRGRHKLLGQVAAASALVFSGLVVRQIGLFGYQIDLGLLAVPATLFWLVGAINAINLLDGVDGMAATLGVILSLTIALMAAWTGHPAVAVVALVFAGSLLGFLRYNFPPASIFLGDSGSMLIGLMVGALAIRASIKGPGTVLLAAPLVVWTLPIFDSLTAILRRKLTGRSIYTSDRGHLHHRLMDAFGTGRKALLVVALCSLVTSAAALASVSFKRDSIALATGLGVVAVSVVSGVFGRGEFLLLAARLRGIVRSLLRPRASKHSRAHQACVRLQGTRQWELLWETLTESADRLQLERVHLNLNLPAIHEGYNATWERPGLDRLESLWRMEFPLVAGGQPVGFLRISGKSNGEGACERMETLLDLVRPFETRLQSLAEEGLETAAAKGELLAVGAAGNGGAKAAAARLPELLR
jgi:UDP-GlcNAc:undecaprenyl-phosphate GlcNAc-1-phosphate transferase